jgi:hypothetical protein
MSVRAKRELLGQISQRYREAGHVHKTVILNEFIAATGYARKYAIRLLSQPVKLPAPIKRLRPRRYGPAVQEALTTAWSAANYICAKRLVPFLPELVAALECHGHLDLGAEVRAQLLNMSAATADRILRTHRQRDRPYGVGTTKAGKLLKHQVPLRTFTDWDDVKPGFFEIDLVAHCGTSARGAFLYSLVLTDVATGWTECIALPYKAGSAVIQGVERTRMLLPFPLLGLDSDNGSEFINREMVTYCAREEITFTRGRAYKKNDQCFVEQKNGSIVRQIVGYDRFEGDVACKQLGELYQALRLYVNFFQPSVKLRTKHRQGAKVQRQYDAARTPFQRLSEAGCMTDAKKTHVAAIYAALDPVRLLQQIQALQDALWRHAIPWPTGQPDLAPTNAPEQAIRFEPTACVGRAHAPSFMSEMEPEHPPMLTPSEGRKRKYQKSKRPRHPRVHRTRLDPFEAVHTELHDRFLAHPNQTTKNLFIDLQARHPGQYPDHLLRTLQRRVLVWRSEMVLTFNDGIVDDDNILALALPRPLVGKTIFSNAVPALTGGSP